MNSVKGEQIIFSKSKLKNLYLRKVCITRRKLGSNEKFKNASHRLEITRPEERGNGELLLNG